MSFVKLNWRPGKRELRQFGAIFLVSFVAIGTLKYLWPWQWLIARDEHFGMILVIMGLGVGSIALTGHIVALPFYWAWLGIAFVLGNITSRLIIAGIFFLVVTPLGLLGRLARRDRLWLRKPRQASYWQKTSLPNDTKRFERQF